MHILQVSPRVPFPLHDGGAIGIYNITKGLLDAGHRVTMLAINTPKHHQPADVLAHLGPNFRLVTVDVDTSLKPLKALQNLLLSKAPYNVERFINSKVLDVLIGLLQTENFEVIQYEGTFVAWYNEWLYSEELFPEKTVTVLRAHNIEYVIWERLAAGKKNLLKRWYLTHLAARMRSFEEEYLGFFDAIAAITEEDIIRLKELGCPEPIALIPAAVEMGSFQPDPSQPPQPRTVFMIGSLNWLPNLEGLDWLLREVWPAIHAELPELELHVAGVAPPGHLTSRPRGQDNVFIHGFVESAAAFMRQYDLMLVPLLSGGGMRVKIIEGMALGKCILSTGIGAEGIAVRDGHDIVLRDTAAAWQQALRDYYHGRLPVAALGAEAARTAAEVYDNRRVTQRFEALYAQVGAGRPAAAG
ncbi:glycosyltransferase family 4 protein [Hymenobacter cheonanensis]|uniref:glycosyltransferase family 4 protein n=1 Tax=Hymenobacter sp. CA2-7 TaxID=3063993 RepID=UPI0027132DE7|nr:glycosyltransferase family 4 protein [Hymenobacter sp. CA2-7]MDO7883789.1 glycosyltransferase family 4 protein [Hymenobacter sp. CA2-7]